MRKNCKSLRLVLLSIVAMSVVSPASFFMIHGPGQVPEVVMAPGTPPVPSNGETRQFDVLDIRAMSITKAERYLLSSIEGIVNKESERLYIVSSAKDKTWLQYINQSSLYNYTTISATDIYEVVAMYEPYFNGTILFNASCEDEANIATPLCGRNNSLLVDHGIKGSVDAAFSGPVVENVTASLAGKLTREARYRHALDTFKPTLNQTAFGVFVGGAAHALRSYLVAESIFSLWNVLLVTSNIDGKITLPDSNEEIALLDDVLATYPENTVVYGYPFADGGNEVAFVSKISKAGMYLVPSDWIHNLVFWSRMALPEGYQFQQARDLDGLALENKVYVSAIYSDGDNIQFVQDFMRFNLWAAPGRGSVPLAWSMTPEMLRLMPWVMKFYYENASANDYFVCGLSGKGYAYPEDMSPSFLATYINDSQALMDAADFTEVTTMRLGNATDAYTAAMNVEAVFEGYGFRSYIPPRKVNGIPVIYNLAASDDLQSELEAIRQLAAYNTGRPTFISLHLHCWTVELESWVWLAAELEASGIEVVRLDELARLANMSTFKEGEILDGALLAANIAVLVGLAVAILAFAVVHARKHGIRREGP